MTRVRVSALLLLAVTAIASPATAAPFTLNISSPVGTPSCGNVSESGALPVSESLVCSPIGGGSLLDGSGAATFGHVGGSARAAVGAGYFGAAFGIGTQSTFTDDVIFTAVDPTVTHVMVAANLAFSGTMNATANAGASVDLFYNLGYVFLLFSANDSAGVTRNHFNVVGGSVSGTVNDALLSSGAYLLPVNTPVPMTLQLTTSAGVFNGNGSPASATSLFSNSFEIPIGIDAFVLPRGVTANAGDWLVNNRRVGAAAVPEPATWALITLGCGGAMLRRRRLASCRSTSRLS